MIVPESRQIAGPWNPQRKTAWHGPVTAPTDTYSLHERPSLPPSAERIFDFPRALAHECPRLIRF